MLAYLFAASRLGAAACPVNARLTGPDMAKACLDAFLSTDFGGGRHGPRVDKLSNPATGN